MSRATARSGLAAFLTNAVTGINTVYTTFPNPQDIPGDAFFNGQPAGTASGAVLVVFIADEVEERIAMGGQKRIDYTVELHLFHRSTGTADDAMAHFDGVVEALKVLLRGSTTSADHTLGGTFWQAYETPITTQYGIPAANGALTETWAVVNVTATEMLAPQA